MRVLWRRSRDNESQVHAIDLLPDQCGIAEFSLCRRARFAFRHATRDIFVRFDLHVGFDFGEPFSVPSRAPEEAVDRHVF